MAKDFFLTGASSGIGRHLAKRLVQDGGRVLGIARTRQALEELQQELGREHFLFVTYDVSDLGADVTPITSLIEKERFSPMVVILNAGVSISDLDPRYDFQTFRKVMDTNLYGAVRWIELFLPQFQTKGSGHFIGISSMAAYHASPQNAGYPASKAALSRAFDGFRMRYRGEGIHFTSIHFGPVRTRMWNKKNVLGMLSIEEAVDCVMGALKERKAVYDRPVFMAVILKLLTLAPVALTDWLTEKTSQSLSRQ